MPELPEVETIARGLQKHVAGDVIQSVWLGEKPETFKSPPQEIVRVLEHAQIKMVRRVGKHIVFDLERRSKGKTPRRSTRAVDRPPRHDRQNASHLA